MSGKIGSPAEVIGRLRDCETVSALEGKRPDGKCWVVGGAVRNAALDQEITDVDFAVAGPAKPWAIALARKLGGSPFRLSSEFGTWRVVDRKGSWSADFSELRGESIGEDLSLRDFTINAMAVAVGADELLDPLNGLQDLGERRLVAASEATFSDDPLRLMRAARQSAELGLEPIGETLELARSAAALAGEPAPERTYMELRSLIGGPDPARGLTLMAELGIEDVVLPELTALRGLSQGPYHHLDAYEHTLEVLRQAIEVELGTADAELGEQLAADARELLGQTLGDTITRATGLRLAALCHDFGKAETRMEMPNGRIGFPGHDAVGEKITRGVFGRLRASRAVTDYVASLTAGHLRLGFMVHRRPLSDRDIHAYLRGSHPWATDLTLLTVADRLATRGRKADEAISAHLELASDLLERAVAWEREGPPRLPIDGAELAQELGIEPGPELGRIITDLEADAYAGELGDRATTVERARERIRA